MKPVEIKISNGQLTLAEDCLLHIKTVEVFTGDDGYTETDTVELESRNERLVVKRLLVDRPRESTLRLRNEPGVRIHFSSEDSESRFVLSVRHHKGAVVIDAWED